LAASSPITPAQRKEMERLELLHGREKFLVAGRSFLKNPPAAVNAKSGFGWSFFISGFEGFVASKIVAEREADSELQNKTERDATNRYWDSKGPLTSMPAEFIETLSAEDQEYIAKVKAAATVSDLPEDAPARSIKLGKLSLEFTTRRHEKQEQEAQEQAEDLFK
jgi:hypothetical protein